MVVFIETEASKINGMKSINLCEVGYGHANRKTTTIKVVFKLLGSEVILTVVFIPEREMLGRRGQV